MATLGKTIWIADAISPLGAALAKALSRQGHFVIASGHDARLLRRLAADSGGAIAELVLDIDDATSLAMARQRLATLSDRLDVLVANTSLREPPSLGAFDAQRCVRQINANYLALVKTVEMALPLLQRSRRAHIVCAGSAMATTPLAGAEAFGASAAAVEYFARALALELREQKIDLSLVRVGMVRDTDETPVQRAWAGRLSMSVDEAAQRLMRTIDQRQSVVHLPRQLGWLLALVNYLPRAWWRGIWANVNRNSGVIG